MGNMIKCAQGHYFDQDQNSRCPFCGVGSLNIAPTQRYEPSGDVADTAKYVGNAAETANNDGNTVAYDLNRKPTGSASSDPEATKAIWTGKIGIDPVVGWLVCTAGGNRGRDYRIRAGWNSIGRDPSMQICIAGDETISREDHAKIFFDIKNQSFHVATGAGRSGIYVNGQAVLQPTEIRPYDKLEIGNSTLQFVPFCSDNFRWES